MFIWDDDCEFSFKIVTQKKIYFLRAKKEADFLSWKTQLERRLDASRLRLLIVKMEHDVLNAQE